VVLLAAAAEAEARRCKGDAVHVGAVCVDKYEASVWEIPATNTRLIKSVQKGKLTSAAELSGGTQRGVTGDDYGAGCPDTGNGCKDFYAVSIAGVTPSANLTWFQAAAACRNASKRLATNQEWQMAALGTPDPGTDNDTSDCNVSFDAGLDPTNTGSRSLCVSDTGNFDMVGNLWEWVADWGDRATSCTNWSATYGTDVSCVAGTGSVNLPGALFRGGDLDIGTDAGVFAVNGLGAPSVSNFNIGFRCAREP
jgi:formylglycine-generating enzyme required for sulfatase activity